MADNDKLVEWIEDRLDEANDPRQDFLDSAAHAHYLFNNDLERWVPGTEEPIETNDGHPVSTDNMIQPILLDAVSLLLKNYPMFRVKPTKPTDFDLADEINKHVLAAWRESQVQRKLTISQLTALMMGMSVLEVTPSWNMMGEVQIDLDVVPLSDVWFNPKLIDTDNSWVIRRTWHSERQLELDWGDETIKEALGEYSSSQQLSSSATEEEFPDWWDDVDDMVPLFTVWIPAADLDPDIFTQEEIDEAPYGRKVEL